jgi:hypothetical protein
MITLWSTYIHNETGIVARVVWVSDGIIKLTSHSLGDQWSWVGTTAQFYEQWTKEVVGVVGDV